MQGEKDLSVLWQQIDCETVEIDVARGNFPPIHAVRGSEHPEYSRSSAKALWCHGDPEAGWVVTNVRDG